MLYYILKFFLKLRIWFRRNKDNERIYDLSYKDTLNILDKLELVNLNDKVDALDPLIVEDWFTPEIKQKLVEIHTELVKDPLRLLFTYTTYSNGETRLKYDNMVYDMVLMCTKRKIDIPFYRAYGNVVAHYHNLRYHVLWSIIKFWGELYDIKDRRVDLVNTVMYTLSYNIAGKDIKTF